MNRPTKPGVITVTPFHYPDLRTWERCQGSDSFRVGIWGPGDAPEGIWGPGDAPDCWLVVWQPPWPWRHREGTMLAFLNPDGRSVPVTGGIQLDLRPWLHVSVARQDRMPSYKDLAEVKELFIGASRQAIQVFPPESNHVNLHPYRLHLWCCLEGDGLPDFTCGGASI